MGLQGCKSEKRLFEGLFGSQGPRQRPCCSGGQGNILVGTRGEGKVPRGHGKVRGGALPGSGFPSVEAGCCHCPCFRDVPCGIAASK